MIAIPRFVLQLFRAVGRRAGFHKRRPSSDSGLSLTGDGQSCRLRAASGDTAVEYDHVGRCDAQLLTLPWEALDALAGKGSDLVSFDAQSANRTSASWSDHGVPRQTIFDAPKPEKLKFPEPPGDFAANDQGLWSALRDAVPVCDPDSSRYALNCLHLRGPLGRIDAADGRHVLTQCGFQFPWKDDLLVPGIGLLGCRELDSGEPVGVGRTDKWIGFRTGPWLVMLAIQDGRFPKVDDIIPNPVAAKSRLEISARDAEFLSDVLPRLPNDDPHYDPITLDLNGQVLIRARETGTSRPTQVELSESRLHGEPVVLNTNRLYLAKALRLGFRTVHCFGSAVLACDERRRLLWMQLEPDSAIKPHADPIRIERSAATLSTPPKPVNPCPQTSEKPMSAPSTAERPSAPKTTAPPAAAPENKSAGSPIEQAVALRTALVAVAHQAGELIRSLKRHKRQAKLVQSTLDSLKELQKVAA